MTWTVLGVAAVATVLLALRPSLGRELARYRANHDATGLLQRIRRLNGGARETAYNRVIKELWESYDRTLAAAIIRVLVEEDPARKISQFWLMQLQQVEPEIADATLGTAFISAHYRPEIAARCGSYG